MTRQDSDVLFKEKLRVALKTQRLHKHLDTLWDMGVNMTSKLATSELEDVQDTDRARQADARTDDEEKGAAVVVDKTDHGGVNNDDEQERNQDLGSMDSGGAGGEGGGAGR